MTTLAAHLLDKSLPSAHLAANMTLDTILDEVTECVETMYSALQTLITGDTPAQDPARAERTRYLRQVAHLLFDFAVEGKLPQSTDNLISGYDLETGIHDFGLLCEHSDIWYQEYGVGYFPRGPVVLFGVSVLRYRLSLGHLEFEPNKGLDALWLLDDHADLFSLKELAMLARMGEKSVRNATHMTKPPLERLETIQANNGTYVTRESALAWLSRRRKFSMTSPIDAEGIKSL